MQLRAGRLAFKVALIYVIVAGGWISFSDELLLKMLVRDPNGRIHVSIVKAWCLVAITGVLLYYLLRRILKRWEQDMKQRRRAESAHQVAEEKLRRSEEQLRLVMEASTDGLWDWNLKTGMAELSSRYWEMTGYPAAGPVVNLDFLKQLVHPEDWPAVEAAMSGHVTGQSPQTVVEYRILTKNGAVKWMWGRGRVVEYAQDGSPLRMVGTVSDITQHKLAEQQLRESEERYRRLFELESDAVVLVDCETHRYVDVNQSALRLYGYTREELLRMKPEDVSEEPEKTFATVGAGHIHIPLRWHRKKNGQRFAVEITANQINHQGRRTELATLRDITVRQQTMEMLQETAQQLLAAQRLAHIGSYCFDVQAGTWTSSVVLDELFGIATQRFQKDLAGWLQLVHPEDRAEMERYLHEVVLKNRTTFDRVYRIIRQSDQAERWVHGLGKLVLDGQGQVKEMAGIIQDITERKQAEETIMAERTRLRTLIDLLPDAIFVKDVQGRFLLANKACARVMGVSAPVNLIGKTDADFYPPGMATEFHAEEQAVWAGTSMVNKEDVRKHSDGTTEVSEVFLTTKVPLRNGGGKITGLVGCARNITERKKADQALRESQALYHSLVMQLPVGVFQKNQAGQFVLVNPAFCRLKGVKPEDFLGKTPLQIAASMPAKLTDSRLTLKLFKEGEDHHQQIMRTGKAIELEEEYQINGDRKRCLHVIKLPVLGADGKVIGSQGIQFDITERKLATENLAKEQKLLRTLVDHLPVAVYLKNTAGHKTMSNPVDRQNCGVKSEAELLGKTDFDFFPPEQAKGFFKDDQEVFQTGRPVFNREEKLTRPDGETRWLLTSKVPLVDDTGRVSGLTGIALDITERKQAEESHARLATAVEQAAESIMVTDPRGVILYVNPASEKTSGYTKAEALGQNPRILKSGKQDREFYRRMWEVLRGGEIWSGHFINRRKDGTLYEEEATISPVRDAAGKIVNYVAVKRDVTREVQLEAQFRQSQKMEAIGQLAGGVAHDFNNILAVIQLQAGLLKVEQGLSGQQMEYARDIEKAAQRAANLIRQLLLFSRKQALHLCDMDLNEAVNGVTKMLQRILGEHVQMQFKLAPQPLLVHADTSMLDQVLINLAVNARDAMTKGGQIIIETAVVEFDEATVAQTTQARPGSFVRMSVTDTGCGIPQEVLPRIFEPFFTTKDVGKGSGLGLATVFGIIQQHHGWVNVYSEPGRGTTFRVYLPRRFKATEKKSVPATLDTMPGGTETILLVEDDAALRANVRSVLTRLGYRVLEAAHGQAAVEIWRQHHAEIRLLLTDMVMPGGMTGIDVANELLKLNPELKVIYASGYSADIASNEFSMEEGVNFLTKPFEVKMLAQTIRNRLGKS